LIVNYQQRFHVDVLLILDPINWGSAFSLKSSGKISFPSHDATRPLRKRLESTLRLLGPRHHRHRRRVRTPSPPLLPPSRDDFDATVMAPSSTPPSERHRPHPAVLHHLPHKDGCWSPRRPRLCNTPCYELPNLVI
jgi:hypothetical protein